MKLCLFTIGLSVLSYSFAIVGDSVVSPMIKASISQTNTTKEASQAISVEKALDKHIDSNVKSVKILVLHSIQPDLVIQFAMFNVGLDKSSI